MSMKIASLIFHFSGIHLDQRTISLRFETPEHVWSISVDLAIHLSLTDVISIQPSYIDSFLEKDTVRVPDVYSLIVRNNQVFVWFDLSV